MIQQKPSHLLSLITVFAVLSVLASTVAAAEDLVVLKAGEQGHIGLDNTVVAGDLTLRPGHYRLQHRAEEGQHFVRFTRLDWKKRPTDKAPRRVVLVEAEVACEIEQLQNQIESTAFYTKKEGRTTHLTRVEIKGERIAHLF